MRLSCSEDRRAGGAPPLRGCVVSGHSEQCWAGAVLQRCWGSGLLEQSDGQSGKEDTGDRAKLVIIQETLELPK